MSLLLLCLLVFIDPFLQHDPFQTSLSADSVYKQASAHLDNEQYQEAIGKLGYLKTNKDWGRDLNNLRKTFNNLGYAHYSLTQFDSSIYYYQKSNEYAIALKDTSKIIASLNSISMGYRELYQFGQALEYSLNALELAKQWNQSSLQINILTNLGLTYRSLGRNMEALHYHRESYDKARMVLDSNAMANSLHNIALIHKDLESLDSSLYYNLKSLELKAQLGNKPSFVVSTLNNIGITYLATGNHAEAEKYFIESNVLYKQVKDTSRLLISYNNLGDLALRRNQLERSQAYLDSGAILFPKVSDMVFKRDNLELRLAVLERKKDFEQALPVYRDLTAINERIFQEEKLKVQEVEASYRISQESLLRETAEQQAILAEAEAKAAKQFLLLFGVIVLLSLIFGVQLFRLNKKLKTKNAIIQDQKRDNEHRIYNFLSRLQGLLRMASENVSDPTSRGILQNSEAAIISAAALQEHLTYTDLENEEMLVGQYLEGLTVRLREMFQLTGNTAKLEVTVKEDVRLPVQTVMNIGLIVAEIVTNSMKYAFPADTYEPAVGIMVQKTGETLSIQVGDNGIGISDSQKKGMGSGLIQRLAKYIKAELTVVSDSGTRYSIALKVAE
jgi:two-component sensor histidine kinase